MTLVTLARKAMNTRFELVLHGTNPVSLQAAGEAALMEIERLDHQLSLFKESSEIARVNALAAHQPVRVSPEVFSLLVHAKHLSEETGGAFDITMAPLLRCWGMLGRSDGRLPEAAELAAVRAVCGISLVELNPANFTVKFARAGVMLDLGAIGKGYGVEKAAEMLREAGVESALIHGGTSTISAIGVPPDADTWKVALEIPHANKPNSPPVGHAPPVGWGEGRDEGQPNQALATIPLRDESLSVSAVSGKCFVANGRILGHIIDPRTGAPATGAMLSAVVLPSATESDALSTALLVQGVSGHEAISSLRPGMRTLVTGEVEPGNVRSLGCGIELPPAVVVR